MNKDFRSYKEAKSYVEEVEKAGYKACIQEFWDFDGRFYTVLVF